MRLLEIDFEKNQIFETKLQMIQTISFSQKSILIPIWFVTIENIINIKLA